MNELGTINISHLSWGEITVEIASKTHRFKDCQIWPGGAREWDWKDTGTSHTKGVQVADVEHLISRGAQEIVISRGQQKRLQVAGETEQYLDSHNIPYHISDTRNAIKIFNQLAHKGRAVGGLFHSTC